MTFDIPLDSPIIEIEYEQWLLQRQLQVAHEQFEYLYEQTKLRLERELLSRGCMEDEHEAAVIRDEIRHLRDFLLPRFIWNPVIISGWAVYELGMKKVAKCLSEKGVSIDMRHFMENLRSNFERTLRAPLNLTDREWDDHKKFQLIRHSIAHANGSVDSLKNPDDIKGLAKSDARLVCYEGYIIVSQEFVNDCVDLVEKALSAATTYLRPSSS